ncbi:MAG: hypothetical protein PVG14_10405 [Anaerolineales bacterium]|jgi:hypothetical protein
MWDKLVKSLAAFSDAVVTGLDPEGYPYSVRCTPQVDHASQVLHVQFHPEAMIQPGPAGLLCHSHDEWMWDLKSFAVHGRLERQDGGWIFRPQRYITGMGMGGLLGYIRMIGNSRRAAKRYLERRGLPRPAAPWDAIKSLRAESKRGEPPGK